MQLTQVIILVSTLTNVLAFDLRGFRLPQSSETLAMEFVTDEQSIGADNFPYLVCISFQKNLMERSLCSGSIIANEWILTAAHCAINAINGRVYLGASTGIAGQIITHAVTESDVVLHPAWDSSTGSNDIALIKIPYTSYSAGIQAVKLPTASSFHLNYNGDSVIAPGWQHDYNTFSSSKSKIKWNALQVVPKRTCSLAYNTAMIYNTICTVAEQQATACSTDAGGPLVLESSKIQIGLNTLRDQSGCSETYSAVFTRVTDYLDWIKLHTGISNE